ncbi:MAG: hypothetical protein VX270_01265, partial [Actinomycetota bacterium]|nr:hypothetical protein [Actinomycetota bacterium]
GSWSRTPPHHPPSPRPPAPPPHRDEATVMTSLQHRLLEREVYLSGYGMGCVNLATSDADVHHLLGAMDEALELVVG